jgi:hypothetical protein
MKLKTVYDKVKYIIKNIPESRENSLKLILHTYKFLGINTKDSFENVVSQILTKKYPTTESITRAARKVYETYPELKTEKSNQVSIKKEEEFRDFYGDKGE